MAGITDIGAIATDDIPAASYFNAIRDGFLAFMSFTTYTPTLAQGVSTNIAKTVNYASYATLGKIGVLWVKLSPSGAGTAGSTITCSLPSTWTIATSAGPVIGIGHYYDASANTVYNASIRALTTTTVDLVSDGVGGGAGVGATPNFAVASPDTFQFFAVMPLT